MVMSEGESILTIWSPHTNPKKTASHALLSKSKKRAFISSVFCFFVLAPYLPYFGPSSIL